MSSRKASRCWWAFALLPACAAWAGMIPDNAPHVETLQSQATVVAVTMLAVIITVVLHYEVLDFLSVWLGTIRLRPRPRVLLLIFAVLAAHVAEIWVFGAAYYLLTSSGGHGALLAGHPIGFLDNVYFSAVCFTTLGLGDVVPVGAIRFVTGTEALTGFVLITWSASFAFLEMQKFWRR